MCSESKARYVFEGRVIRLNAQDYNDMWQNFVPHMSEGQWLAELSNLDDWFESRGKKKGWYFLLSSLLQRKTLR